MTGRPASSGRRNTSTAAMNWSRSTCSTQWVGPALITPLCPEGVTVRSAARRAVAPLRTVGAVAHRLATAEGVDRRPVGRRLVRVEGVGHGAGRPAVRAPELVLRLVHEAGRGSGSGVLLTRGEHDAM